MTEVEQQLREALARHADDAPPPVQLLHAVRVQSRRRRRRQRVAVAGGLALLVVAGVASNPTAAPDRGQQVAAPSVELAPGALPNVDFPYTPPGAEKPFVGLEAGRPVLVYRSAFLTEADRTPKWWARPLALTPSFTFDLVPLGFTMDNMLPSVVTFAPPDVPVSAGFAGKIAVMLDEGSKDGVDVTNEGTVFHRSLGDGRTLTIQVPPAVPLGGADLTRFANGVHPTGQARVGHG
jgi:hypothetical protein